ncbi:HEAT repeat domain-containing protein [Actinoplanes sp. NPDC000266]
MSLGELLPVLHAAVQRGDDVSDLVDAIEAHVEEDPEGSRTAVRAYSGDDGLRLWVLGLVADPRDFDVFDAALADPELRLTALEAVSHQPDTDRVDAIARSCLDDPEARVRSRAVGMVGFAAKPGALDALLPRLGDPDPHVRMQLAWRLGGLRDSRAESALCTLLTDPDEAVRKFATRGIARLARRYRP